LEKDGMGRLTGKVAIVTGVSTGLGKATAIKFAEEGANLAVNEYHTSVADVLEKAKKLGSEVISVKCDNRKTEDVNNLVKAAYEKFGRVDVIFANAGIHSWARTEDLTDEEWDYVVDCDLKGGFRLCRAVIPIMKKQKYGRIIVSSSIAGSVIGWSGHAHYCSAKAGLVGLVRALAVELARDGITANAISIGTIRTPQTLSKSSHGEAGLRSYGPFIPVGHVGIPEDIAECATYLASEEAGFLTGENLVVDGGFTRGPVITLAGENQPPPPGYIQRYDKQYKSEFRSGIKV
jgi:3-oxoacyl-[acyl-carrier protein] reductase